MPNATQTDDFWADLLDMIEAGRVIPVIGEGAFTYGDENKPLRPWLAKKLAASLLPQLDSEGEEPSLSEVVCLYLLNQGRGNTVYTRLNRILAEECPAPGATLLNLASISAFNLYLTTCFSPLLQRALDAVRFKNQPLTETCCFGAKQDLPFRRKELGGATVYHVFGKVSASPTYAVWEEDVVEFICELSHLLNISNMKNLALDLREHSLLVVGLNFSDWLVRFFMRVARQEKLSKSQNVDYLAEAPTERLPKSIVLFFGGAIKSVQVVPLPPADFAAELARRWRERHPPSTENPAETFVALPAATMPKGAIFISYARENEQAVKQLKADLEKEGCLVWYDRERLKPGVNWHNTLEDEVTRRCALFLSVISRHTESEEESYFHLERNWARDRFKRFSDGGQFYIPVVIDDSPTQSQREPREFRHIQATRLPGGVAPPEFSEHLRQLQVQWQCRRAAPAVA
jgi:hypothetical protein